MKDKNGEFDLSELKTLEDELRKLPPPPVPDDLESRLLKAIPTAPGSTVIRWKPRLVYRAASMAAALVFALGALYYLDLDRSASHTETIESIPVVRNEEIMRTIEAETTSARLLASANILFRQAGGESFARETYQYLAENYPDTVAGREAMQLIKN